MSAAPSKSSQLSQPAPTTFNERLNEQLINCLNVQTNVIQNLAQYSQHISLQLFEIKNVVEMLSNRVLALQQQQQHQPHFAPAPYAAPYYPNYMPHQPMPMPHPPPTSSHPPPPMPPTVQPQQPFPMRPPAMSTAIANGNPLFATSSATGISASSSAAAAASTTAPFFQFSSAGTVPPTSTSSSFTQPRTSNAPAPTTTTPTKTPFSGVPVFGTAEINVKPAPAANNKPASSSPFTFGTTSNLASIFGVGGFPAAGSTTTIAAKQETHAEADGESGGEEEPYEPDVSFKPIVTLSAVEVKTGEEDENVLFCERAKLFRFDTATSQMKERGIGDMKILQHKTNKTCRILMRREQVLKLCANHQISSHMELKPHQGTANAFLWSATDFADGEAKHETLCVKFKTDEQAKNFLKVFNEAKDGSSKKADDAQAAGKSAAKDDAKGKPIANDDDVIPIGDVKPSAEQIDRAKKLQLPSTFFLYENKEPCKGCPGCKEDTPPATVNENKTATNATKNDSKTAGPQTPATKTPLSSSENIKFSFLNADKSQPAGQKQTSTTKDDKSSVESPSTPNAASQYDNKPSIFGGFNGSSPSSVFGGTTPTNNSTTSSSIFGGAPSLKPASNTNGGFSFPGFGGAPAAGFQFSTPTTSTAAAATTTVTETKPTFSFGAAAAAATTTVTETKPTFSFGAAAAAAGAPASTNSSFSFGASDKPLFGNAPKFSFSDLAKQSSTADDKSKTNGSDQRVFAGQGSLVFGTSAVNTTSSANNQDDDDGEGGGEDDSYEPNVSFKPIVTLSAVDVKTGEEDENVLFCERGKLYRFDPENNQMKERGIGEMKILQHKTTKVCRILMRREQVLKLCANHQITAQMELKPHQGTENAYVWSAMDFADGEAKHETLCVRFKASDAAKRFVQQFNDAKQAVAHD